MNILDWFPLGWTGWISLQSKGLSRVFSNTTYMYGIYKNDIDELICREGIETVQRTDLWTQWGKEKVAQMKKLA